MPDKNSLYLLILTIMNLFFFFSGCCLLRTLRVEGYETRKVVKRRWSSSVTYIYVPIVLTASSWAQLFLAGEGARAPFLYVASALASVALFLSVLLSAELLFHVFALNRYIGRVWVKGLDFVYLAMAFVGLLRLVNSSTITADRTDSFDIMALLFVAFAIAVRLAKAILEVFFDEWIKSEAADATVVRKRK